jgi:hypothetical protein
VISTAAGQGGGRFEEAKRMGMSYIQGEQFDRASGRLEEVWEQDQSDPTVGEFLAVAYLNTEDRRMLAKMEGVAFAIIDKLVASGSRVTFLVQHSHEKLGWLQGRELNQYCRGRLSIENNRIVYVSEKGERKSQHSFDIGASELKAISLNADDQRGTFQLKFAAGNYFIATRNRNRNEARRIVDLVHQQVGSK